MSEHAPNHLAIYFPALLAACLLFSACNREPAYDPKADVKAELQQALSNPAGLPVLLIFGANWCPDCRVLDKVMKQAGTAESLASSFAIVKVDVGNFDKNQDLVARFGNPTADGIPAAVLLGTDQRVRYVTKAGELANAKQMGERGILDFFSRIAREHGTPR